MQSSLYVQLGGPLIQGESIHSRMGRPESPIIQGAVYATTPANATLAKHLRFIATFVQLSNHLQTVTLSLHIDLVGPLHEFEGMKYFFMIVDYFTKWPEAFPLSDVTAKTCARALIRHWIPCFEVPDDITTNCCPQVISHLWSELNHLLRISTSNTIAYHPQANGIIKCFHLKLKSSLRLDSKAHTR